MNSIDIEKFCEQDYVQFAVYQSFRSIANYIDGFKPAARKIVYTVDKQNITEKRKLDTLMSDAASLTQYIHGGQNLYGVIVNLAQNYVGSNNYNILDPRGNFGSRFVNDAAASRYIYTHKSKYFNQFINKQDEDVLIKQNFEGSEIEYKFYVPTLPLILLNGSEGIGNGYAQKILPRNMKDVTKAIKLILEGKEPNRIQPSFKGFNGSIKTEGNSHKVYGKFEKTNSTTLRITEIPIGYDLSSYVAILNKLSEDKIIKNYSDHSDSKNDKFLFNVYVSREFGAMSDEEIYSELKLVKSMTENFTCTDENNMIIEFQNEIELLKKYISVRIEYYEKRKQFQINKLKQDLIMLFSKINFITDVLNNKIIVNNKNKKDIEQQITANPKIVKHENGYDYLLNMPIYTLTKERVDDLMKKFEGMKNDLKALSVVVSKDLWLGEFSNIKEI